MSISLDNIVQYATGTVNADPVTVTLPGATTDGNTVIICVSTQGSGGPISTGFTRDHGSAVSAVKTYILRKSVVPAGETSYSVVLGGAQPTIWFAFEISGINPLVPKEVGVSLPQSGTGVTSQTTGTTPASTAYQGLAIACWGGQNTANSTIPAWSNPTNSVAEYGTNSRTDGATAMAASVGFREISDLGTFESTQDVTPAVNASAVLVMYVADDSKRVPNLDLCFGAEYGTTAGHTTGNAGNPPLDFATNATYSSTTPRTGTYSLQLTGAGSAANAGWNSTGALGLYTVPTGMFDRQYYTLRFSFRFVGGLPSADVGLAFLDTGAEGSGSGGQIFYRNASQKLGARVRETNTDGGTPGTEQLSATTIAADTWYDVDMLFDGANAARQQTHALYWQLDAVEQAAATLATINASTTTAITSARLGWTTSSTGTLGIDDVAGSKHPGHYPLGDIKIYPLKVDPAATPTVTSGAAFSTFTANGTINSTFSVTTARDAIDDIPPTIGASADGFVQDAIGTTDYVEFPMQTRDVYTNLEAIRAVRWYFPGWAVDATAATIGFRAYDGTAETTLFVAADPNFDASTTTPAWVCKMMRAQASSVPYVWTQAKLDALCARVGFSGDATPDIGVHAVLAELAVRVGYEQQVVEQEGMFCYSVLDPDTGNVIAIRLVAPEDTSATGDYTINSSPVQRNAVVSEEDLYIVGAESNSVVSFITAARD